MASQQGAVDHLLDQIRGAGTVDARKMFGKYGIFCNGRMVALLCDDQLFVKPTGPGRALAGELAEAPPFRGAKPWLLIPGDRLEDGEWLTPLIRATAAALPVPAMQRRAGR